jgi:hypothetical protein
VGRQTDTLKPRCLVLLDKEIAQGIKASRTDWEYASAAKWNWLLEKANTMFARKIDKENLAEG